MDTTPFLSRSPSPPKNSHCSSGTSSPEYSSPDLATQQYNIFSLYGTNSFCSMASNQDSDIPLYAPGTGTQHVDWDYPTATLAPNTSTTLMTELSSMEYDPFGSYKSDVPASYPPGFYPGGAQRSASLVGVHSLGLAGSHPPALPGSGSPPPFPVQPPVLPSSTATFPAGADSQMPALGRMEYNSQFQPPRLTSFSRQIHPHYIYGMGSSSSTELGGLATDNSTSVWGGSVPEADTLYSAAVGSQSQQAPGLAPDQQQRGTRPRRQPRHMTTKEEANFQCEVSGCGKLFSRSYNYKAHLETHDEKREYPFPCQMPGCDKRFVRKTDLQRHHQSVHMKERNHKCDYCGRLFARKDTLRRHMDDGCSRRFDIETHSLGADGINSVDGADSGSPDHPYGVQ